MTQERGCLLAGPWVLCSGGEKIPPLEAGGLHSIATLLPRGSTPAPPSRLGTLHQRFNPLVLLFLVSKMGVFSSIPASSSFASGPWRVLWRASAGVRPHLATVLAWMWAVWWGGGRLSHSAGLGFSHRSWGGQLFVYRATQSTFGAQRPNSPRSDNSTCSRAATDIVTTRACFCCNQT